MQHSFRERAQFVCLVTLVVTTTIHWFMVADARIAGHANNGQLLLQAAIWFVASMWMLQSPIIKDRVLRFLDERTKTKW